MHRPSRRLRESIPWCRSTASHIARRKRSSPGCPNPLVLDPRIRDLVEAADLNALLRAVDGLCAARDWDELEHLAELCLDAIERGKQLWPIAAHIDYRLALEAPGEHAASVLESDLGRFSVGPLTEVAGSTHPWEDMAPHIYTPQAAAYVAQERVLRGEDLTGDERTHSHILELPLRLYDFEPTYTTAKFSAHDVEIPEPWEPRAPLAPVSTSSAEEIPDARAVEMFLDLVQPWTAESNGAARAVVVDGSASAAAAALVGPGAELRLGELEPAEAVQRMAWAAASGGAHGRRRGAAFGRFMAWYVAASVAGLDWPPAPNDLGDAIAQFRWFRWDEGAAEQGWVLRLAVEDPAGGWTAAIAATDVLAEELES